MRFHDFLPGLMVGLAGGFTSGLLGVSPGGGLVVLSVLLLGSEQHVAQGISLVAQIPPTSLSGINRYRESGYRSPPRWLILLTLGFSGGSVVGAYIACFASNSVLQWSYVAYLVVLDGMLVARGTRSSSGPEGKEAAKELPGGALLRSDCLPDCRQAS
jgi:uncharacterized protein